MLVFVLLHNERTNEWMNNNRSLTTQRFLQAYNIGPYSLTSRGAYLHRWGKKLLLAKK